MVNLPVIELPCFGRTVANCGSDTDNCASWDLAPFTYRIILYSSLRRTIWASLGNRQNCDRYYPNCDRNSSFFAAVAPRF
ncbi:MAG: hypothetical protein F6K36_11315 [Symploca sp. SIO3C6]|nr:hypothetical protein [Symploca sp. SIO3C6]